MNAAVASIALPLDYEPTFREWGIPYFDGGSSQQTLRYCPFCGTKLPKSLRHEWFEILEQLGLEWGDEATPDEMQSDRWWIARGL